MVDLSEEKSPIQVVTEPDEQQPSTETNALGTTSSRYVIYTLQAKSLEPAE